MNNDKYYIHRYLTLQKFQWLLEDGGIFLAPASQQSDNNEGIYDSKKITNAVSSELNNKLTVQELNVFAKNIDEMFKNSIRYNREQNFISSWYMGLEESEQMWQEYAPDGVIIISTRLALEMCKRPALESVKCIEVIYNDVKKSTEINNPLYIKNENFKHEKEYRLIFNNIDFQVRLYEEDVFIGEESFYQDYAKSQGTTIEQLRKQAEQAMYYKKTGVVLKYNLDELISEIRLHPNATNEELEEIQKLCDKHKLTCKVIFSQIKTK